MNPLHIDHKAAFVTALVLRWRQRLVTEQLDQLRAVHAWQAKPCLHAAACILMTHLAAGLAAADTGGVGAGRGRTPPPAGKPGEGLAPGTGAAGLGPCAHMSQPHVTDMWQGHVTDM